MHTHLNPAYRTKSRSLLKQWGVNSTQMSIKVMVALNINNLRLLFHNNNWMLRLLHSSQQLETIKSTMRCQRKLKVILRKDKLCNRSSRITTSVQLLTSMLTIHLLLQRCTTKMEWVPLNKISKGKSIATRVFWKRVMQRKYKRTKI